MAAECVADPAAYEAFLRNLEEAEVERERELYAEAGVSPETVERVKRCVPPAPMSPWEMERLQDEIPRWERRQRDHWSRSPRPPSARLDDALLLLVATRATRREPRRHVRSRTARRVAASRGDPDDPEPACGGLPGQLANNLLAEDAP
jgi:hypothetical protein